MIKSNEETNTPENGYIIQNQDGLIEDQIFDTLEDIEEHIRESLPHEDIEEIMVYSVGKSSNIKLEIKLYD